MPDPLARCRACGVWVCWVTMISGRRLRVNPEPASMMGDGDILIRPDGRAERWDPERWQPVELDLWISHAATCSRVSRQRKERLHA